MPESEIINKSDQPVTRRSLVFDLGELGIKTGMTVLVHSSLSSLGWVCGGPHTASAWARWRTARQPTTSGLPAN